VLNNCSLFFYLIPQRGVALLVELVQGQWRKASGCFLGCFLVFLQLLVDGSDQKVSIANLHLSMMTFPYPINPRRRIRPCISVALYMVLWFLFYLFAILASLSGYDH
jgi:hypothetical protein